jgi:hypothetical protein
MTRVHTSRATIIAAAVAIAAVSVAAGQSALTGSASLGVRSVDVGGTEAKYREDLNLADGLRLRDLHLSYVPRVGETAVDRIDLDAEHLGGDPFESVRFAVRKYGAYHLRLDHHRSEYYYDDTILPAALASVSGSTAGDFHRFDFARSRSTANFELDLTPATQLSFGSERQTRTGQRTTTLTLERDEFLVGQPLDETSSALTLGLRHAWKHVTLIVDEQLRDLEAASELLLPGLSPGHNTADAAELQFYVFGQPYDSASRAHALRLLVQPTERLDMRLGWRLEDVELDFTGAEDARGSRFAGTPFTTSRTGGGAVDRDVEIADLDVGFALTDRVRLIGGARRSTLQQAGDLAFGLDTGAGAWDFATDGFEAGAEVALSQKVVIAAGWSRERRAALHGWTFGARGIEEETDTDRTGFFGRLRFNAAGGLELDAAVEDDSIDDPFTLASPTSSRRYKLGVKRRWSNGLSLAGSYRRTDVENERSNWLADTEQANLRLMYRRPRLQLSAGLTRGDFARSVQQAVTAGTRTTLFAIDYAARSTFGDATARWELSDRIAIGGELRWFDNRGSVGLTRDDDRGFVELHVGAAYLVQVSYRDVEYLEDSFDRYDARILELAFGRSW